MFAQLIEQILSEFNSAACLRDIGAFWQFRSTVPSPGLRQASEFLVRRHHENGVPVELHAYPADDQTPSLDGRKNPLVWTPRSAELRLVQPANQAGLICSYAAEPLCLISNSTSTPPEGLTAEVVVMHSGTKPEDYEGVDVRGKIIFTDVWPFEADEQARQHGAAGILTDSVTPPWLHSYPPVRRPADVPDLTMWGTLNPRKHAQPLWGFSLSPRQGQRLRRLIQDSPEPFQLFARVDADLCPGESELVTAWLAAPDSSEEIWVLSHSSEPGALDDASGCCLTLEIARVLKVLLERGSLPPLRRSIRFLNAVEVEGYFPYLHENLQRLPQVKAALALDSIGSDFRQSGGIQRLFRSPAYNPSFADALLETILSEVAALPNERFCSDPYDLFPWRVDPCFPGNDNYLGDGFFDIPTPMLCNWPDRFYHSNQDTVDKLSPNSLGRGGLIAAIYLYYLASSAAEEAPALTGLVLRSAKHRLINDPSPQVLCQGLDELGSLLRFMPETGPQVSESRAALNAFADHEIRPTDSTTTWEGRDPILRPLRWRFPAPETMSETARQRWQELCEQHPQVEKVWSHLNGRRSASELQLRLDIPPQTLIQALDFFTLENLAEIQPESTP